MSEAKATTGTPRPTIFVLFGATGDLAKRMVLPAFYELANAGLLPQEWRLIGNGRGDVSHLDFRQHVHDVLTEFSSLGSDEEWESFRERLYFAGGGFSSDDPGSLLDVISEAREAMEGEQLVHYFAVPPTSFGELTKGLGEHDLTGDARVVYEKPFGTSAEAFHELDKVVHSVLDESQAYRIDHFLGKEATQDLHVMRFANSLISGIWDAEHVESVQIDVPETLDVADRALFYDATGAILDMLVTHLFQVAAEVAMEPPASLDAADLQSAREGIINKFRPIEPSDVVLGQYEGYLQTEGVKENSRTETFVAAKLWIDSDRWRGVPFLLRTGKQLARSEQRVSLVLRTPEGPLSNQPAERNVLSFSLSGSGEVDLSLVVKEPGPDVKLGVAQAKIPLANVNGGRPLSPYSRLIHDVLLGDRSLFTRPDGLEQVWKVSAKILTDPPKPIPYAPGSWGPAEADELVAPQRWLVG
ncbi:glucose-6-phosphate 1-dehydrogenase [Frankineae bacterium MT45]|nr:glucose-6-phosphate 1-dehydrogenase [Frankineae bacterium MT45]